MPHRATRLRFVPTTVVLVLALGSTAVAAQPEIPRTSETTLSLAGDAGCRFVERHLSAGQMTPWPGVAAGDVLPSSASQVCRVAQQAPTAVGPDEDEPLPETLDVAAGDPWFSPAELTISGSGSTIIRLQNAGGVVHNLTVDELGIEIVVTRGSQGEAILTDVKPGTYAFYCSISGHREAGMEGTLIIR